jgi:hypothetical protein
MLHEPTRHGKLVTIEVYHVITLGAVPILGQ